MLVHQADARGGAEGGFNGRQDGDGKSSGL